MVARRPTTHPALGMGSVSNISHFSEHGHVDIKLKTIKNAATWLPTDPNPWTLRDGPVCENSTFSEHGNVAYQIKENHHDPGEKVSSQKFFFSEHGHVAHGIKGNHECSNKVIRRLPPPPLTLWDAINR